MIPTSVAFNGPSTVAPSVEMGENCTVWQYATICEDVTLGEGVVVGSHAWIGRGSVIAEYTRIQHGAFIPNHSRIGRGVFIGPNATLCDDKYPRAGRFYRPQPPVLEDGCSIGAGAVVLPAVRIGRMAMVGAGAVVDRDVPPHTIVSGVPARATAHEPSKECV